MAKNKRKPFLLTPNELKVLEFIESSLIENGFSPSFEEIKQHFGFASYNSVQRYIKQLQDKGFLSIPADNSKRALQVLRSSEQYLSLLKIRSVKPTHNNEKSRTQPLKKETLVVEASPPMTESLSLPLLGKVAAGAPIEAFHHDEFVDVPTSLVRSAAKTFALSVQGQSMIEDGILDGDVILVQKQSYARNGETVVAMINNQATVKRFYSHSSGDIHRYPQSDTHVEVSPHFSKKEIELRPANSSMESMWFSSDEVDIQGIVVGLIRRF
ncbi:MAG TPA: repressor LexA [Bdellovibrionales bacterium]|nr:repressor LexA [Pseudobdellovibrionaceae bacterium]HAG90604.1 repressor LexA [Bdellovibrionales bacterium]|tara:strand:- start:2281 stop:3087 length:807 start_codon:yes stop_codon:yes gene_type:complete